MDATLPLFDDYKVNLEAFEGPLDLLLHLIRKDEVDIYNIPIERITNQYMAYLARMQALDINVAGEFVVMAATLMLIKSRTLLPKNERSETEAETENALDPRLDLVRQLVEYKRFKDAADQFAVREWLRAASFPRGGAPEHVPTEPDGLLAQKLGDIGTDELLQAFRRVLERAEETVSFGHLKMHRWSVPDKMRRLLEQLHPGETAAFSSLFPPRAPKGEIIVTFVALLELIRLRHLTVSQADDFGELFLTPVPEGTPDAHLPLPEDDPILS